MNYEPIKRISQLAEYTGLSTSSIRKDLRTGYLEPHVKGGLMFNGKPVSLLGGATWKDVSYPNDALIHWLEDRKQRCGGLTVEAKAYLEALYTF